MSDDSTKLKATRILLTAAAVFILVAGLKLAQSFFIPVLLAAFIATVSFPITLWLRSHKVPRPIACRLRLPHRDRRYRNCLNGGPRRQVAGKILSSRER
jgi:hypothetical protein